MGSNILRLGQKVETTSGYKGEVVALSASDAQCIVCYDNHHDTPKGLTLESGWIPQASVTALSPV